MGVTRAQLMQRALQRADFESSQYVAPAEIAQLVDTSLAKMHNLLAGLYEDYFVKLFTTQIVDGQPGYTLPADFMKLRAVFYAEGAGYRMPLDRLSLQDLTRGPSVLSGSGYGFFGYMLKDIGVELQPVPSNPPTTARLDIYYIPAYQPALDDNQSIEFQIAQGWEEWCVNDVAIQLFNRAQMDPSFFLNERNQLEAAIRHQASQRDSAQAKRVRNTGPAGRGGMGGFGYGNRN